MLSPDEKSGPTVGPKGTQGRHGTCLPAKQDDEGDGDDGESYLSPTTHISRERVNVTSSAKGSLQMELSYRISSGDNRGYLYGSHGTLVCWVRWYNDTDLACHYLSLPVPGCCAAHVVELCSLTRMLRGAVTPAPQIQQPRDSEVSCAQ